MEKISNGILGGFSGTAGTVVGGKWKGIDYMHSKPTLSVFPLLQLIIRNQDKYVGLNEEKKQSGKQKLNIKILQIILRIV
jgi:hypothetical protein